MKLVQTRSKTMIRVLTIFLAATALITAALLVGGTKVSANHPVLVEGNCDSPVPGTTLVAPGTCGDFDGDGRIGTAEDTDGADRIFGTLNAALGPGTGAAAGTGANFNGRILIVKSGRFAETLYIGQGGFGIPGGTSTPVNVEIEAAPGVDADIDAVLQGDPAGGNTTRQNSVGIFVLYPDSVPPAVVSLRNLTIRNFNVGVAATVNSRVHIDRCRIENNKSQGVLLIDRSTLTMTNTQVTANGRRNFDTATPGDGIRIQDAARARISDSTFSQNVGSGIINAGTGSVTVFKVGSFFNGTDTAGVVTIAANPNFSN